jgi:alanine racemase
MESRRPVHDMAPAAAVLTIDLAAVVENHQRLRARAGVDVAGVVKADAYGLGAQQVAPALAAAGCRRFFVAALSEGVALRAALNRACAIHVLNGLGPGEAAHFLEHDLVPVLNDLDQIAAWRAEARERRLPAVVHIDTGMSRLGLTAAQADALCADPAALDGLELTLVMSHLVVSEEPDHPLNAAQLERFARFRKHWPKARASLANSSGVFLGGEFAFDLVRPGAATYGINPIPGHHNPMRDVARLQARVLQLREIAAPESVGYGATWRASSRTRIATVACGYADGWLRAQSNRGAAHFQGRRLPFVGRVSMDLITLDANAVPELKVGDMVDLMGPDHPVDAVAEAAGTNGYEVLTRLGRRLERRYLGP